MGHKHKLIVTMQARDANGKMQKVTFDQRFNTHEAQLLAQAEIFPAVRAIVEDWGIAQGAAKLEDLTGPGNGKVSGKPER